MNFCWLVMRLYFYGRPLPIDNFLLIYYLQTQHQNQTIKFITFLPKFFYQNCALRGHVAIFSCSWALDKLYKFVYGIGKYNIYCQIMSVKVGVRVRPYNQREKDLNCRLCVDMMGPTTRLFDADDPEKFRDFTFDYSFWSHDQFHADERGYFVGDSDKYADQQHVFEQVGLQILANAWEGYHCCLFAYGQTGAGKSYSMVGYGANKGIVPISCQQIFKRVSGNQDKNKQYQVNVSMLQIYNEKVQDLLVPINKRLKDGYKIREHKTLGIYVEGLTKHYVDTYESIEAKMDEGSKNRSIAATEMNASSSRAHTIIFIQFKQIELVQGKKREKLSVIYLVDLAGSQKVGKTGATGDRLKEAAGINKSLSVLGLVISTLADKAMGKGKGVVVPYRDSCLTRILQNALGGNSKTLMICAISPATDNYEETLSTLRYADQAKKIQNKAVVNQSETDKIIRNLTQEKDELRQKVQKFEEMFKKLSQGLGMDPQKLQEFNDAKQQLRFNTMMMNDYSMSKSEKLQKEEIQSHQIAELNKIDKTKPHLSNLNEDPQLSRRINYSIDQQICNIGRRNADPRNDIQIGGMGIRSLHAKICKSQSGQITIEPVTQGEDSGCYLNGDNISQKTELKNLDRLTFGTNNMFIVAIPGEEPREQIQESKIDWDYAQNQLYLKKELIQRQQNEERERKIKEEAELILKKKEEQLAELQKKLKENEQMRKNIEQQKQIEKAQMEKRLREEEAERLKREIEKDKKKIKQSQDLKTERIKQKYYFEKKLLKTLPQCIELNLIAKEFKRNINMSVKMLMYSSEPDEEDDFDVKKRSIKVKVVNKQAGYVYWWDSEKLSNRYYIIKDMSEQYFENGVIPKLQNNDDPFWDPPEPVLIGRAFLTTKALSYMFDNPTTLSIIGEDDQCGELDVNMVPTDETGTKNLCQEMDEQEEFQPEYLLDNPFYFNMIIEKAKIPENYQNVFVEYALKKNLISTQVFKTNVITEKTQTPVFNYNMLHSYDKITSNLLEYLMTAKVIFKVYGNQILPIQVPKIMQDQSKKKISTVSSESSTPTTTPRQNTPQEKKERQVEVVEKKQKKPKKQKTSSHKKEETPAITEPVQGSKVLPDQVRAKKQAELKDGQKVLPKDEKDKEKKQKKDEKDKDKKDDKTNKDKAKKDKDKDKDDCRIF